VENSNRVIIAKYYILYRIAYHGVHQDYVNTDERAITDLLQKYDDSLSWSGSN